MNSRLNLSECAEEMIKKINICRDALGFEAYGPSLIVEIALNGYLIELENLVRIEKKIESGAKNE